MEKDKFDFRGLMQRLADDLPYSHRQYAAAHGGGASRARSTQAGRDFWVIEDRHDAYDRDYFHARGLGRAHDDWDNRKGRAS